MASERPLGATVSGEFTSDEYYALAPVLADASIGAFRGGVVLMGALAMVAGAMALVGLREPTGTTFDAHGTIGCPATGVRTHPDAPPIASRAPGRPHDLDTPTRRGQHSGGRSGRPRVRAKD